MGPMGARFLVIVPVAVGLFPGNEGAHAQSASSDAQALPPIVVSRTAPSAKPGRVRNAPRTVRPRPPALVVYPTTPISGSGIDVDKVPSSVNIVDVNQI